MPHAPQHMPSCHVMSSCHVMPHAPQHMPSIASDRFFECSSPFVSAPLAWHDITSHHITSHHPLSQHPWHAWNHLQCLSCSFTYHATPSPQHRAWLRDMARHNPRTWHNMITSHGCQTRIDVTWHNMITLYHITTHVHCVYLICITWHGTTCVAPLSMR